MKKIYLVPGMGETCNLLRYKKLSKAFETKGFFVVHINPDWKKPLTKQLFKVEKKSVVFGFSMGAVLAYLSVQKKPCKKLILASISPVNTFRFTSFQKFLREHMSVEESIKVAHDILDIQIKLGKLKTSYISIMGEKEKIVKGEKIPDFIVPKTTHRIDKRYIEAIIKII